MSDDDERTLRELEEERDAREGTRVPTESLDEEQEAKESRQELLARRSQFATALREDDLPQPTADAYQKQIGEIDDVLSASVEQEVEAKRAKAEKFRRLSGDKSSIPDGWEDTQQQYTERADELDAEADELEKQLDSGSSALSSAGTDTEALSADSTTSHSGGDRSRRGRKVSVAEALSKWDIDRDNIQEAIQEHKQQAVTLKEAGHESMAENAATQVKVLQAAAREQSTWEPDTESERFTASVWGLCSV